MSKTALITGIRGMDAAHLSELLLKKGYKVIGTDRRSGSSSYWRLKALGIKDEIEYVTMDLLEYANIRKILEKYKPNEVYHLAAQSFVQDSFEIPLHTFDVNAVGTLRLLEAIREVGLNDIKLYNASSSEMFGKVQEMPQKETTPFYPRSPYGTAKLSAFWNTKNYRESFGMFNCSGILFNHTSFLRGLEFITKKITTSVADIIHNNIEYVEIGNVEAKRDWGFAGDYVEAQFLMLQQDIPDDYVIASGETHTVKEFINYAFKCVDLNLNWKLDEANLPIAYDQNNNVRIKTNPKFYRPCEVEVLLGDATKAKMKLGWEPKKSFHSLIEDMVYFDLMN